MITEQGSSEERVDRSPQTAIVTSSPLLSRAIAAFDWSTTSAGPRESWPQTLRTLVAVALASRFPVIFWWGEQFVQFYNDAFIPVLGEKHPRAVGQPAAETWPEIWDVIGAQIQSIWEGGPSTWNQDLLLCIDRYGFMEEAYFTFSYSPILDESFARGIAGVYCTVQETTQQVVSERRMRLLRDLAARGSTARTVDEECRVAVTTLDHYQWDVPFSMIYLFENGALRLAASSFACGAEPAETAWPFPRETEDLCVVDGGAPLMRVIPHGPWPEPTQRAVIVPIPGTAANPVAGYFVAGTSPRQPFDNASADFFELMAAQIGTSISNARAYEEERKRTEALLEIDRAKNVFFSNVSHEFRTPLTLMLGPLSDLGRIVDEAARPLVEMSRRNALRLLKLVNNLLEFSRLEAGRSDPSFAPTDLGALTADICSAFRSVIEGAGLTFHVDVALDHVVYVDVQMWERILLNLLSNAFKFTLQGEIRVELSQENGQAVLRVTDTGTGIAQHDLARIFERFRQVRGARGRSYEGSGIGLALSKELVELHGGTIAVSSVPDSGTTFTVCLPFGAAHLRPEEIRTESGPPRSTNIVEQYLADLTSATRPEPPALAPAPAAEGVAQRARILVVDDNADLREYLARILGARYTVATAPDGGAALEALRADSYDLVISDVMMPRVDGLELLAAIRNEPRIATIPVIVLSARAGEEATVDGLAHGADDYIAKPFSAEQLMARVQAQLEQSGRRERAFADQLPIMVFEHDVDGAVSFANARWFDTLKMPRTPRSLTVEAWREVAHPDDYERVVRELGRGIASRDSYEITVRLKPRDVAGEDGYRSYLIHATPQFGDDGTFHGWIGSAVDVHDSRQREQAERALLEAALQGERDFRALAETIPVIVWTADPTGSVSWYNYRWYEYTGQTPDEAQSWGWQAVVHPDDLSRVMQEWPHSIATGGRFESEFRLRRASGAYHTVLARAVPVRDKTGEIVRWYGSHVDIQQQKDAMERTRRVAETLQGIFLPDELPVTPQLRMDAIYQAAQGAALVGGDWFHATQLPDGKYLLSIGDVAGHGLEASIIAGRLRYAISDAAFETDDPAAVLQRANRILRFEYPGTFATAVVAFIDSECTRFRYASAGHPPPLLAQRGDISARALAVGGVPLGIDDEFEVPTHGIGIAVDDVIALYTDGLTEFARDMERAETALRTAVARIVGAVKNREPAAHIRDAVLNGAPTVDDVALLIVQFSPYALTDPGGLHPSMLRKTWRFHSSDAYTAHRSRQELTKFLRSYAREPETIFAAELVVGEILANTVEHAPGLVEVHIDWTSEKPIISVLDTGPGLDDLSATLPDAFEEDGRGLFLIKRLAERVTLSRSRGYGTELRAVLPLVRATEPA